MVRFSHVSWHCDQPALFAGMLEALTAFGGLPRNAVFDNASTAVKRVLVGRTRDQNVTFRAFSGALALPIAFAAPAKGNEQAGVEVPIITYRITSSRRCYAPLPSAK